MALEFLLPFIISYVLIWIGFYIFQRFNFKKAELSKQQIEECLTNQQIEGEVIRRLLKVIDECEFAKFAPAKDEGGLKDILNETTDVLKLVDK